MCEWCVNRVSLKENNQNMYEKDYISYDLFCPEKWLTLHLTYEMKDHGLT